MFCGGLRRLLSFYYLALRAGLADDVLQGAPFSCAIINCPLLHQPLTSVLHLKLHAAGLLWRHKTTRSSVVLFSVATTRTTRATRTRKTFFTTRWSKKIMKIKLADMMLAETLMFHQPNPFPRRTAMRMRTASTTSNLVLRSRARSGTACRTAFHDLIKKIYNALVAHNHMDMSGRCASMVGVVR